MPDFGSNAGLKRGTRQWLFALSVYYASDSDVVFLCKLLEREWNREEERGKHEKGIDKAIRSEDEWGSCG